MRTGLVAESIGAIIGTLVSLPLRSPVDNVFNTTTVAVEFLLVRVAAGLIWNNLTSNQRRLPIYAGSLALGLIAVVVIAFAVSGLLTPSLGRVPLTAERWPTPALLLVAAVMGIGLAGQGDAQSGDLALPKVVGTTLNGLQGLNYQVIKWSEITFTAGEQLTRFPLPNEAVVRTTELSGELNFDGQHSTVEVDP